MEIQTIDSGGSPFFLVTFHLPDVSVDEVPTVLLTVRGHVGPRLFPQKLVDGGHEIHDMLHFEEVSRHLLQHWKEIQ